MAVTTFEAWRVLAAKGMIGIADINASEHLTAWGKTGGRSITWACSPVQRLTIHGPKEYTRVLVDDHALTVQASIADVDANPGSFYWDGSALYVSMVDSSEIWYHTIYGGFTLYVCSGSHQIGRPVYLNGHLYWPYLADVATIQRWIGDITKPSVITSSTTVTLFCGSAWRQIFLLYSWTNQDVEVRVGGEDLPYSQYARVFTGLIRLQQYRQGTITFEITDNMRKLDQAFPSRYIATEDCDRAFNVQHPTYNSGIWNVVPTSLNANCATQDAAIGAVWPFLIGKSVAVVPHMLSHQSLRQMTILGTGISHIDFVVFEVNLSPGVFDKTYFDARDGKVPQFMFDSVEGVMYDAYGNQKGRYAVCDGPALQGHANFPGGPVIDNPADAIQYLLQTGAGLSTPWDETSRLKSRFLCSLMPIQIHVTSSPASKALETSTKRAIPVVIPPDLTSTAAKPPTLLDICNRICMSSGSVLFQNNSGEFVFRTLHPDTNNAKVLDKNRGAFIDIQTQVDQMQVYPSINVGFGSLTLAALTLGVNEFVISESIAEIQAEATSDLPLTIPNTYLENEAGARCLANRIARWGSNSPITFPIIADFSAIDIDIGDTIQIDNTDDIPREDDSIPVFAVVTGVGIEIKTGRIHLEAVRQFKNRQAFIGPAGAPVWGVATAAQRRASGFYGDDGGLVADGDNASLKASLNW